MNLNQTFFLFIPPPKQLPAVPSGVAILFVYFASMEHQLLNSERIAAVA
jgi:hypothetical protein